ncbi:MAG: hypothetical protein HYW93_00960 [Thaumarchaeota archaeon]|nr:hypothetical protein [Nitrososphaerota archaeon]
MASLRPDGWRLTAWVAGLLPALLGLASVVFPDLSSSLGLVWGVAAIAWGVGFVAAAELTRKHGEDSHMTDLPPTQTPTGDTGDDAGVGPGRGSTTSTPRWVYVFGIIVIILAVLFVILHLTGGGFGSHAP